MSWLISKLTGRKSGAPPAAASDATPPSSSPSSPIRATNGPVLHFAPERPSGDDIIPAEEWILPADALKGGSEVCRAVVSLYMQQAGSEMELKFPSTLLLLVKTAPFTYEVKVLSKEKVLISQPLVPSLTFYFKPPTHTLVWNMSLGGMVHALVVCFADDTEESQMKSFWNLSYLETGTNQVQSSKLGDGDQKWAILASDAMEVDDGNEEPQDELDYDQVDEPSLSMDEFPESTNIRQGGQHEVHESALAPASSSSSSSSSAHNDNLAVGMRLNRTFVNRGSQIGVFKHDDSGSLRYLNNVPIVKDLSGQSFAPSKMMLHDEDGKMLLLNSEKKDTVYEMDLEYGKVVQEYNAGETINEIRTLAPLNKYAERTGEATLLGVSKKAVFQLDPRQGKNALAEHKEYKTTPKFSSLSTTSSGYVAVGADDGQIRLYDSISKVAKTCLPGLGDAIIGMDVTADGTYLLATTKHYLLVIPTAVAGQEKVSRHTHHTYNKHTHTFHTRGGTLPRQCHIAR